MFTFRSFCEGRKENWCKRNYEPQSLEELTRKLQNPLKLSGINEARRGEKIWAGEIVWEKYEEFIFLKKYVTE